MSLLAPTLVGSRPRGQLPKNGANQKSEGCGPFRKSASMAGFRGERRRARIQELRAMGLKLTIDDFGTGYSSLSYLKQFPVSRLKIDRSFVSKVAVNPDDAAITAAITAIARNLSLKVIAEGAKTKRKCHSFDCINVMKSKATTSASR